MIDLHTHTLMSDGVLLPSELVRRAQKLDYRCVGLADHADASNLEMVVTNSIKVAEELNQYLDILVIPGVELTHIPPASFSGMAKKAREMGAAIVVAHGESPVEPVAAGTNRAAIEAGVDILAHPGLITEEEIGMAAAGGVLLEISAREGHSLTNGRVVALARKAGARMILNTDAHEPRDLIRIKFAGIVAQGAGLSETEFQAIRANTIDFVNNLEFCKKAGKSLS